MSRKKLSVTITKEQVEKILKDELCVPKYAKMEIGVEHSGNHDKGTYKEELGWLSFEWEEEV